MSKSQSNPRDIKTKKQEEVCRRLPPVNDIKDKELRGKVIDFFANRCPKAFWEKPASSSGKYHPADTTNKHGLWLHTLRVVSAFERLHRTKGAENKLSGKDKDYGIAACLLHDAFKYGRKGTQNHTDSNHDEIAASFLRNNTDIPEEVVEAVKTHSGPWGPDTNRNELQEAIHLADMVASQPNAHITIENPPEELLKTSDIVTPEQLKKKGKFRRNI